MQFKYRPSEHRGGADHGWLKTFHTFSFASYYDPRYENFGALRVINEDRVAPGTGFPTHPHREAEIFSYIISGQLSHKDTMGNVETMVRGDIQMTSGGTGIAHSEYNDHPSEGVHFLQIWALPNRRGLKPKYFTRHFTDEQKKDKIAHLVAPVGYEGVEEVRECSGLTPIHSPVHFFSSLISPSISLTHKLLPSLDGKPNKLFYVQLVQSSGYNTESAPKDGKGPLIKVTGGGQEATLGEGDGVFITGGKVGEEISVENVGKGVPYTDRRLGLALKGAGSSPFVFAAQRVGIPGLGSGINAAMLTSALSNGVEGMFSTSRGLYGMALKGKAPKVFTWTNRGVPYMCLVFHRAMKAQGRDLNKLPYKVRGQYVMSWIAMVLYGVFWFVSGSYLTSPSGRPRTELMALDMQAHCCVIDVEFPRLGKDSKNN
ncbi:pirin [Kwoniella mangroviensis CBS 10435]|uniref:Pirin n=1 Tax=Kwoniella mangroviensis CBS 10435 TaxID=1331196 RepID=A0A1B9IFQ0_9TREE|nr:pirin [Kwoniella mangroviensis CBS 10435]